MNNIPKEITEIISYLSQDFHKSIKSPIYDVEDLYNDLVVFYLEKYDAKVTTDEWFIWFKNFLRDKYRRAILERRINKELSSGRTQEFEAPEQASD